MADLKVDAHPHQFPGSFHVVLHGHQRGQRDLGNLACHFLDDILRISDTVTIFRNVRKIVSHPTGGIDKSWVIERMIGKGHHELEESYTGAFTLDSRPNAPVVLEAAEPVSSEHAGGRT